MAKNPSPSSRKSPSAANSADAKASPERKKKGSEDALPDGADIEDALAPLRRFDTSKHPARIRDFFRKLSQNPPQVLLLEGGDADLRVHAALYWALLLNCEAASPPPEAPAAMQAGLLDLMPQTPPAPDSALAPAAQERPVPCFTCAACVRMATHMHRDLFFLDGRQGSIKIDEVRVLKGVLGEPPREAKTRVVVFCEAQALGEAAANSLLKSFEEPAPATSFVLLAPQRERLLPTLVSRSFALTLPWPLQKDAKERERLAPWEAALCSFLLTGRDFFERTGTRGTVDAPLVYAIIALCRQALCACLLQKADRYAQAPGEGLESIFARLPDARLRMLDEALAECQDSLVYSVNPTLVLEWLASRMFLLIPRKR